LNKPNNIDKSTCQTQQQIIKYLRLLKNKMHLCSSCSFLWH